MKRLIGLTLMALILSGIQAQAGVITITTGTGCTPKMPVGPWYLYWPMEAHFQTPASPQYPYWPAPMTLPNQAGGQGMAGYNPYGGAGGMQAPGMGYYPGMAVSNPGMNGYNSYQGMPAMGGYGPNPYQAPTVPVGGYQNNSAPLYRTGY